MTNNETNQLILYAMAGAGFQHFDVFNNLVTKEELIKLTKLISQWRGNRTKLAFYQFLFEINGFKCEEVFLGKLINNIFLIFKCSILVCMGRDVFRVAIFFVLLVRIKLNLN